MDLYRGMIVFPRIGNEDGVYKEEILEEYIMLLKNLNITVIEEMSFDLKKINPRTFIGKGIIEKLKKKTIEDNIQVIAFVNNLSPSKKYNLQEEFEKHNVTITDREEVIIEIFSRNASSKYAKLQVELAKMKYILPRLKGMKVFSRTSGIVGTRGPGEQQLEKDRRHVEKRISFITRKLKKLQTNFKIQGKRRSNMFKVALCGYTNSGKTTLLNRMTGAGASVMRRPFTTLDVLMRRAAVDQNAVILVDTIGFIRQLPDDLSIAFKTTMNILNDVDLIIKLYDLSAKDIGIQMSIVDEMLDSILDERKKSIIVFNKTDKKLSKIRINSFSMKYDAFFVSAKTGEGINELKEYLINYEEKGKIKK